MTHADGVQPSANPKSGRRMFMESRTLVRSGDQARFFDRRGKLMANSPSLSGRIAYTNMESAPHAFWSWSLTELMRTPSGELEATRYLDYAEGFPLCPFESASVLGRPAPIGFCDYMEVLRPKTLEDFVKASRLHRRYVFTGEFLLEDTAIDSLACEPGLAMSTEIDASVANWFWNYFGGKYPTKRME